MELPYHFGSPVESSYFCDRTEELRILVARMRGGIHVLVLSPRRYGKTSLIRRGMENVRRSGGHCAYVNLLLVTNEAELATAISQGIADCVLRPVRRAKRSLESMLRGLRVSPRVSVAPDGSVTLGFDASVAASSWLQIVRDAIELLRAASPEHPSVLVLDEFQVVSRIGRRGVGGAFKVLADEATKTSIVFAGSHLATMEKLTKGAGAPLHGMGETLVLDVIPEDPMATYLQRRARSHGKHLDKTTARHVYRAADKIPNYVQQLAMAAFEASGASSSITDGHLLSGLETLVERNASSYAQQFEDLGGSPAQQRVLKQLARQPTESVYAKGFLDAVGVANANAVTTALRALDARELVSRRGRVWDIADPFLRRWLLGELDRRGP